MDAKKTLLVLVLFVSLLAETQGKSFPQNRLQDTVDGNSKYSDDLSEDKIIYKNENSDDNGMFKEISEDKIIYNNEKSDDVDFNNNDDLKEEAEDYGQDESFDDNSEFGNGLSEDKINYENDIISDSEDNSELSDDLSEDKINYENQNDNDDGDYNSNDDINEDENDNIEDEIISDSEDNSELSDDLSEDKINYENENYNDDGDYNSDDDINEDENDNIEDEDGGNDVSASDLIYTANENANILNEADMFEEDILVDAGRKEEVSEWISGTVITKRAAIKGANYRWPNKILSYRLEQNFVHSDSIFNQAINEISSKSCVKFRKVVGSPSGPYVGVFSGSGCYSYVGNLNQGRQELSIGNGCNYVGTIVHELLHALGFWHEQSRPDRDDFVRILFQNIQAGRESNFRKHSENIVEDLGVPYDFQSVMHYGNTAFAKIRGQSTIVAKKDPSIKFGQRNGMSVNDANKLNRYYKCPNNPPPPTSPPPTGIVSPGTVKYCDFEKGFCDWKNNGDKFKRLSAGTPSRGTGPSADHTSGTGWYIYFETSNPVRTGDYAIIQSELRQATDALCVSFWYNMYGAGMGKLLMGIIKPSSDNLDNVFWSKEGNNGKDWKQASVTVKYAQRFHVAFQAIKGADWRSDIALDDILLKPGPCSQGPVTPVTSAKCDFTKNFCSFTNIGESVKFRLQAGYISMYADRLKSKEGQVTSLNSPELPPTQNTCVSFRYRLTLYDAGGLSVSFTDRNGGDKKELVTFNGFRGNQWHEYQIQFRSPVIHKVIFEASRGVSSFDGIYLDDISIGPGPCPKSVCADVIYEPTKETCCAGILHTIEAGKQCCGSIYYSVSRTRQCCSKGSRVIPTYGVC